MTRQIIKQGLDSCYSWRNSRFTFGNREKQKIRDSMDTNGSDPGELVKTLSKFYTIKNFKPVTFNEMFYQRKLFNGISETRAQHAINEVVDAGFVLKTGEVYSLTQEGMKFYGESNLAEHLFIPRTKKEITVSRKATLTANSRADKDGRIH